MDVRNTTYKNYAQDLVSLIPVNSEQKATKYREIIIGLQTEAENKGRETRKDILADKVIFSENAIKRIETDRLNFTNEQTKARQYNNFKTPEPLQQF